MSAMSRFTPKLGHGLISSLRTGITGNPGRELHVGVVGCGVAGLQVVRALEAKGIQVTAFDKAPEVGGLWRQNYDGYGVQVPKQLFEFPDFPCTKLKWGQYPQGDEVQNYILEYTNNFNLRKSLRLSTAVEQVSSDGDTWTFVTREEGKEPKKEKFDFAVVCTGMYSQPKHVPEVPNRSEFKGEVVHTSDFVNAKVTKGMKTLVVGGGKSAVDCAVQAQAAGASQVTLLQRQAHWPTPRLIAWCIPFQYIFLSRFGQSLVSAHRGVFPDCSAPMKLFRTIGWPLMKPVFAIVEQLFATQFRLAGDLRPKSDVVSDFYGYAHVLDYSLREKRRSGALTVSNGEISSFTPTGVKLHGGSEIACDMVVFGTGFSKDYSIFSEDVRQKLGTAEDGLYLYRHMLPPKVPNLAFIGSEIATISNIMTHGLQAEWLARKLSGSRSPAFAANLEAMEAEVETLKEWKRSWMPKTPSRGSLVLLHQTHYHDQILKDMGIEHRRKWPNVFAEFLMPYEPMDYNGIVGTPMNQ